MRWGTYPQDGHRFLFLQADNDVCCDKALIHPDIVLSAANCHEAVDNVTVIVGSYETQTTNAGAEVRYIGATVPHPGRNVETREYDFVILQLTEPVCYKRNLSKYGVKSWIPKPLSLT